MTEKFTEFGIRVTLPGYSPYDTSYQRSERDAIRGYDHARELHGEEAVQFMTRQVHRTDWVMGKLPPAVAQPPDPDDRVSCGEILYTRPTKTAGSIDTWQGEA